CPFCYRANFNSPPDLDRTRIGNDRSCVWWTRWIKYCGWNEHDFAMFGAQDVGADRRYDQGTEWTEIFSRQIRGDPPFDFAGKYFSITGAYCSPASIQPGGPPLMSAAFSPAAEPLPLNSAMPVHDDFKHR